MKPAPPSPAARKAVLVWAVALGATLVAVVGTGDLFFGSSKIRTLFHASAEALEGQPLDGGTRTPPHRGLTAPP